jgi:hypothetical protein
MRREEHRIACLIGEQASYDGSHFLLASLDYASVPPSEDNDRSMVGDHKEPALTHQNSCSNDMLANGHPR